MNYSKFWDAFYKNNYGQAGKKALWDVPATDSVALDEPFFRDHFNLNLPILDIGCGTGEQASHLAQLFPLSIGIDASPTAIDIARDNHSLPNLIFLAADATQPEAMCKLHEEYGDVNLYIRGVMHQLQGPNQASFVDNLSCLMGSQGCLYFIEVASNIRSYFEEMPGRFSELPVAIRRAFISNLPPRGLSLEDIPELFPEVKFQVLLIGESKLHTNLCLSKGEQPISIPAIFGIVKNQ